jgi:hypothetical protein
MYVAKFPECNATGAGHAGLRVPAEMILLAITDRTRTIRISPVLSDQAAKVTALDRNSKQRFTPYGGSAALSVADFYVPKVDGGRTNRLTATTVSRCETAESRDHVWPEVYRAYGRLPL